MQDRYNVTNILIGMNLIMFLLQLFDRYLTIGFGFIPLFAIQEPWRFVTSIFLHANFIHLMFNMIVLYSAGKLIELRIGSIEFLKLYFLSGIIGNILFLLMSYAEYIAPTTIGIGASGAIAGLLGAAYVFYPSVRILLFFIIPMPISVFFILYLIIEFFGVFNMNYTGIGSAAHLGGALAGYFYSVYIRDREIY
ncbi:MAG: rhomboid family intramembrane serine protease [Candidatus Micrarchaeota archaeon]|nr:rhomboid family intramembrane serine protease [Candidatus Micrarchaeota archaeon]MCX8154489.1 rhomboid family intramembrane serine protease [Candidatus Micrarchaeota archaeon]